jgi:hypothetical protein
MNSLLPAFEFTAMVTSSDLGAVFFANQTSLDRQVALKVFSPSLAADPAFQKAFANSSKLAAGLRHTNLIGILDSGEVGGMPYLVMEFVPGKSLARSTQGHIVEFDQSLTIIDAVAEGLAHAHDAGLVHGHLDNLSILLNQNALPKIGNFGFGRAVHTDLEVTAPLHFTAPEVLANPSAATKASDVYSIAAVFHGLVTGIPFSPDAPAPSAVCGCRPAVDAVIKRATDPDPLKRYSDARAFQAALNQAAARPAAKAAATPARAATGARPTPTMALPKAASESKLAVKIALIVVLLFAIFFTWEFQKKVRADREKENKEIVERQKLAKEQAAALAAAQQALEQKNRPASQPTYTPKNIKEEERPLDSLDRLRSALAAGRRSEMPVGSVKKGDRTYFLIEEKMQWADAFRFAEEHGAFLADPSADFDSSVTKGRPCWLGAARSGGDSWVLSDGKPWTPSSPPEGGGLFLIAGKNGGFSTANADESHSFVIEWSGDGSNPGSLANLLAATSASLGGESPVYPPGTVVSGERRYLFVKRPVTWTEADKIAKSGGGHLLVAATSEEIADVARLTNRIKAEEGIWLGGSLEDDLWKWVTGEPWETAKWADDSEASEDGAALLLTPREGWTAMDRGDTADGFLIEWSADEKVPKSGSASPSGNGKVAELDAKVKELILAAAKKREDEHAANIKRLHWDLDAYLRNLSSSGKDQFGSSVAALKELVEDNRIQIDEIKNKSAKGEVDETEDESDDESGDGEIDEVRRRPDDGRIIASMEMLKLVNYHCEKQIQIDAQAEVGIGKIRDAYVAKITPIMEEAKAAGQLKVVGDIEDAIEDAEDLDAWAKSFGADRE